MVKVRLKINAVDLSGNLLEPPDADWEVERQTGGEIDIASFVLHDPTNTITLNGGKEVIIEDFSDSTNRFFGGALTEIDSETWGIGRRYHCKALGWLFDLSRTAVNQIYVGRSDQFIITDTTGIFKGTAQDAIQKDLSAYTVTSSTVLEGNPNTGRMVFTGETIKDIMDTFAGWAGFIWGVEPDQTVYFRPHNVVANSQTLSDSPDDVTSFGYYDFGYLRNFSEIVNVVYVYGGWVISADQTVTYNHDGVETTLIKPEQWRGPDSGGAGALVTVEKNTGTDPSPIWTAQTVAVPEDPDAASADVIWWELGRSFEFATAPPNLTNSWRVTGDLRRQLFWFEDDEDSVTANGQYELIVKDTTLGDQEAVERRALIELIKRASEGERITLTTHQDGFEVGKSITLVNTIHAINGSYMVNKMVMRGLGGSISEYDLTLNKIPVTT